MAPITKRKIKKCRQTGGVLPQKQTIKRTGLFWGKKKQLFRDKHIEEYEQEDYNDIKLEDYDKFATEFFRNSKLQQHQLLVNILSKWQSNPDLRDIFLLGLKLGVKTHRIFDSNEYPRLYTQFMNPATTIGTKYDIQIFINKILDKLDSTNKDNIKSSISTNLKNINANVLEYITDKNFLDEYKRFVRGAEPYSQKDLPKILSNAFETGKKIVSFYTYASRSGYNSLDFNTLEKQPPTPDFYAKILEINKTIGFLTPMQIESLCNKQPSSAADVPDKQAHKQKCSQLREELAEKNRKLFNPMHSVQQQINEITTKTIKNISESKQRLGQQLGRNTKGSMGIKGKYTSTSSDSLNPSLQKPNNTEPKQIVRKSGALMHPVKLPSPPKSGIIHRHSRNSSNLRAHLIANENVRIAAEGEKYKANLRKWFPNRK